MADATSSKGFLAPVARRKPHLLEPTTPEATQHLSLQVPGPSPNPVFDDLSSESISEALPIIKINLYAANKLEKTPSTTKQGNASKTPSTPSTTYRLSEYIDRFFSVSARGSSLSTEVQAGIANFLTMSYILAANPRVLSESQTPVDFAASATCLASFISTLLATFTNLPVTIAPGLGLSAFFSFGIASKVNTIFAISDGYLLASLLSFVAGAVVLLLALTNLISGLTRRIPEFLKIATTVGLALFLSLIGLSLVGIVQADVSGGASLMQLGDFSDVDVWLAVFCIVLISIFDVNHINGGFIFSIALTGALYFLLHWTVPSAVISSPKMQNIGAIFAESNLQRMVSEKLPLIGIIGDVLSIVVVHILDALATLFAVRSLLDAVLDNDANDKAKEKRCDEIVSATAFRRSFVCVGVGSMIAALFGCSPVIIAMESLSGVMVGGRTGLAALVTALLFALSMPLLPLFASLPAVVTIPCLVFIGGKMMQTVVLIDWDDAAIALPAFVTIIIIPFSYSIPNGIGCGLALYLILKASRKVIGVVESWRETQAAKKEAADQEAAEQAAKEAAEKEAAKTRSRVCLLSSPYKGIRSPLPEVATNKEEAEKRKRRRNRLKNVLSSPYKGIRSPLPAQL